MFIEQKPRNSPQKVIKIVVAPEEIELLWVALVNSTAATPTTRRLCRLLWEQMNQNAA